jgi:REP element-mobilizing transposase RayT
MAELPPRFGVRIHAYVLMPNHFHIMLESRRANIGRAMQFLQSRYSQWLNARFEWNGPLFQGRFQNRIVEREDYWRHLLAYLHLNPVRAFLVKSPEMWEWSSHHCYVGLESPPSWLTVGELQALYGSRETYIDYLEEVQRKRAQPPDGFDKALFYPVHWRKDLKGEPRRDRCRSPEEALVEVAALTGAGLDDLTAGRVGRGTWNRDRWLAMWWLNETTGLTQVEIGKTTNAAPAVVSRSIRKIRELTNVDEEMASWVEALKRKATDP